ncbi:MAG TPA: amidohydrolase [Spirochaetia bacterium]|nr:amidohydrolase [Spirochaetia bacterium]
MARSIWRNANIVTMSVVRPRAEALVVDGGRILFVGTEREAVERAGSGCELIDLGGRTIVPGFNDNHVHAIILGDQNGQVRLTGLSAEEIVDALRGRFGDIRPGKVIIAYDWDYPACPNPTKELLDRAFPDNPVVLAQFGGHGLWMNSLAQRKTGIEKGKPDPPGNGVVLRDESGDPTGVVREMSNSSFFARHFFRMFFVKSLREPRVRNALDHFRRLGITSLQDNTWFFPVARTLAKLRRRGELTARFSCWSHGAMAWTVPLMRLASYDDVWVRRGPYKFFLDGSFSTRTAWLSQEYADDPGNFGRGMAAAEVTPILRRLAAHRRQGAFHAIGDRTVSTFLDAVELLYKELPESRELRFRLEHAQLIRPEDIPRLQSLGVLVSAQPSALTTPEKDARLLGQERAEAAYPHRSLLDAGVHLSFGSDIPGEPTCDPIRAIHLVANRAGGERITAEEALRCYTVGSAYAEFQEGVKGCLAPGMLADFAVLSQDLAAVPRERIGETVVETTVVDGKVVYDRRAEVGEETAAASMARTAER